MESLPFHGENWLEENTADQREEIDDNEKKKKEICNYKPVIANDSWFKDKIPADDDEELTITKFKAHAAYRNEDYSMAFVLYEKCEKLLPANANLILREVGESKVRCLLQLGKFKDCEEIILNLLEERGNPQDSSLQSLLSDAYMALGKFDDAAHCSCKCLALHPEYSQYWLKVSKLFENLQKSTNHFIEHQDQMDTMKHWSGVTYLINVLKQNIFMEYFKENPGTEDKVQDNGRISQQIGSLVNKELEKIDWKVDSSEQERTLEVLKEMPGMSSLFLENSDGFKNSNCFCMYFATFFLRSKFHKDDQGNLRSSTAFSFFKSIVADINQTHDTKNLKDEKRIDVLHFVIWKCIMKVLECFALGKARQLLHKTVQYSKGFAKEAEQSKLSKIEDQFMKKTVCTEHMEWLVSIIEKSGNQSKG